MNTRTTIHGIYSDDGELGGRDPEGAFLAAARCASSRARIVSRPDVVVVVSSGELGFREQKIQLGRKNWQFISIVYTQPSSLTSSRTQVSRQPNGESDLRRAE